MEGKSFPEIFVSNAMGPCDGKYRLKKRTVNGKPAWKSVDSEIMIMWDEDRSEWTFAPNVECGLQGAKIFRSSTCSEALPVDVQWYRPTLLKSGKPEFRVFPLIVTATKPGNEKTKEAEVFDRVSLAKEKGDSFFRSKDFHAAVAAYTEGVMELLSAEKVGDPAQPFSDLKRDLYSSRAEANLQMEDWQKCFEDCCAALLLTKNHVKALWARAIASEKIGLIVVARADAMRALYFWDPPRDGPSAAAEAFVMRLNRLFEMHSTDTIPQQPPDSNPYTAHVSHHPVAVTEMMESMRRLRKFPHAHAECVPLVVEAMRTGLPVVLRSAFLVREKEYPLSKRADCFAFVEGLIQVCVSVCFFSLIFVSRSCLSDVRFQAGLSGAETGHVFVQATDQLRKVFAWMGSDELDKAQCALLTLTDSGLLSARHLGRTLKCLADASLTSTDLLAAIFRSLSIDREPPKSESAYEPRKSLGVFALTQIKPLPLKQWRVIDEELNGLETLISVPTHDGYPWEPQNRWPPVEEVVHLIQRVLNSPDTETQRFVIQRLTECGIFGRLIPVLDARIEWAHSKGADSRDQGFINAVVMAIARLASIVDLSKELSESANTLTRALPFTTFHGREAIEVLQQIRPLSDTEAKRLKRGSTVRLRDIQNPHLRRFNSRLATVIAKLPNGSFKVKVTSEDAQREQAKPSVLTLPWENLRGSWAQPGYVREKGDKRGRGLDGTCANPLCSTAPAVLEGQEAQKWAEENMKRCSRCELVRYCCAACQKDHWVRGHKKECGLLKAWRGGE
uniref:phytol kinase n=1 Tax=Chromera velia CCMP2878 TaxID=1169474 RepID=A0A0G4G3J2_9ALVE|eukprot:Cvel_20016.t1-p1 / transcript=Cvel_20016.t1 / gene=Cvel_20016 / organism=Chromera_velia_CCMP2878 / gene_product=Mitochondrial import receptor subunit TOM70, putative / transcript_product=Mitochondrial import receptor subunit TOM70, putative / location=Cvel_scaffold1765:36168-38528(-) / protein_length=787 / sequence_SO=supercontig / SO=protein_coding / is_pseudo=false